jgi:hypothetical protein
MRRPPTLVLLPGLDTKEFHSQARAESKLEGKRLQVSAES